MWFWRRYISRHTDSFAKWCNCESTFCLYCTLVCCRLVANNSGFVCVFSGGGRGAKEACATGGTVQGGSKIWNSEFGCFWWIGVCVADSDILHPPDTPDIVTLPQFCYHTPDCQCSTTPHTAVRTPRNLHCWSDWSFICCETVEDSYCAVTVNAIQSFALFTCFQILHIIWKFCKKFGQLILRKIFKLIAARCQILRPKMYQIRFQLGLRPRPRWWSLQRSPDP